MVQGTTFLLNWAGGHGVPRKVKCIYLQGRDVYGVFGDRIDFSRAAQKRGFFKSMEVITPSLLRHRIEGVANRRLIPNLSSLLFLNPSYTGVPILAQPGEPISLEELKGLLVPRVMRAWRGAEPGYGKQIAREVMDARDFDGIFEILEGR